MRSVLAFLRAWYQASSGMLRTADPLLMGAAIGFNTLFALFPLAIALVAIATLFERFDVIFGLDGWVRDILPDDVATFLLGIVSDALASIEQQRGVVIVGAFLVALWSGSRAVYTVQKALRLVQGGDDDRGYVRTRLTGIVVTVAAFVAVVVAWILVVVGESAWNHVTGLLEFTSLGAVELISVAIVVGYVSALLYVIYRFGPPEPVPHALFSALLVGVVVVAGSWVASSFLPHIDAQWTVVFGSIGVVLVWAYSVGVIVVTVPIAVIGLGRVLDDRHRR
ncbi:MAG: YihY/virulence factor BrkB family protein [Acidimicrobiia bacterium]|nr:YihY/virulence factor BrkB family protein [Acidimicrobiia bacterium]